MYGCCVVAGCCICLRWLLLLPPHYSILSTDFSIPTTHYSLPTKYCSLLTTYYLLLTTHYSLLTTHYSLLTTHYPLLTTHYSLPTTHYSLLTTHYSLPTTHSLLITSHYPLLTSLLLATCYSPRLALVPQAACLLLPTPRLVFITVLLIAARPLLSLIKASLSSRLSTSEEPSTSSE